MGDEIRLTEKCDVVSAKCHGSLGQGKRCLVVRPQRPAGSKCHCSSHCYQYHQGRICFRVPVPYVFAFCFTMHSTDSAFYLEAGALKDWQKGLPEAQITESSIARGTAVWASSNFVRA